ncbi:hypothetical protein CBL_07332 [Carabus blaptoides fortunei]
MASEQCAMCRAQPANSGTSHGSMPLAPRCLSCCSYTKGPSLLDRFPSLSPGVLVLPIPTSTCSSHVPGAVVMSVVHVLRRRERQRREKLVPVFVNSSELLFGSEESPGNCAVSDRRSLARPRIQPSLTYITLWGCRPTAHCIHPLLARAPTTCIPPPSHPGNVIASKRTCIYVYGCSGQVRASQRAPVKRRCKSVDVFANHREPGFNARHWHPCIPPTIRFNNELESNFKLCTNYLTILPVIGRYCDKINVNNKTGGFKQTTTIDYVTGLTSQIFVGISKHVIVTIIFLRIQNFSAEKYPIVESPSVALEKQYDVTTVVSDSTPAHHKQSTE